MATVDSNFVFGLSLALPAQPEPVAMPDHSLGNWPVLELPGGVLDDLPALGKFLDRQQPQRLLLRDLLPAAVCRTAPEEAADFSGDFIRHLHKKLGLAADIGVSAVTLDFDLPRAVREEVFFARLRRLLGMFYRELWERRINLLLPFRLPVPEGEMDMDRAVDTVRRLLFPRLQIVPELFFRAGSGRVDWPAQLRSCEFVAEAVRLVYDPVLGNPVCIEETAPLLDALGQYGQATTVLLTPRFGSMQNLLREAILLQTAVKGLQNRPITVTFTGRKYYQIENARSDWPAGTPAAAMGGG